MNISYAFARLAEGNTLSPEARYVLIALGAVALIAIIARVIYVNRNREETMDQTADEMPVPKPITVPAVSFTEDNGALVAAITSAIAQVIASEGKDPRGFKVVSFKRSNKK